MQCVQDVVEVLDSHLSGKGVLVVFFQSFDDPKGQLWKDGSQVAHSILPKVWVIHSDAGEGVGRAEFLGIPEVGNQLLRPLLVGKLCQQGPKAAMVWSGSWLPSFFKS
jgi:hypothetical protein